MPLLASEYRWGHRVLALTFRSASGGSQRSGRCDVPRCLNPQINTSWTRSQLQGQISSQGLADDTDVAGETALVGFHVNFAAGSGIYARLWVDDHLLFPKSNHPLHHLPVSARLMRASIFYQYDTGMTPCGDCATPDPW